MHIKHWLIIACGAIALAATGYLIGKSQGEKADAPHVVDGGEKRSAQTSTGSIEPARDQIHLEVALIAYSPKGCQMDSTAMGCNLYPIPAVRIANVGADPIRLEKIAVNKRYNDSNCILAVDKTLQTGDAWMSEGTATGEVANPMAEFARGLRGELIDFRKHCGDRVVIVDVATDRGNRQYEFEHH